jgi:hypothetical protein
MQLGEIICVNGNPKARFHIENGIILLLETCSKPASPPTMNIVSPLLMEKANAEIVKSSNRAAEQMSNDVHVYGSV